MDEWKRCFLEKLSQVQSRWAARFDQALDDSVVPVFNDLADFLQQNGLTATTPMHKSGCRSLKFELAEDAYLLMIFQSTGIGEFELTRQVFVLGSEPHVRKSTERLANVNQDWAEQEMQSALNVFLERLSAVDVPAEEELATV